MSASQGREPHSDIRTRLEALKELFETGGNSAPYAGSFDQLVEQEQFAAALETMCDFLLEPDVRPVSDPEFEEIAALYTFLAINEQHLLKLKAKRAAQAKLLGISEAELNAPLTTPGVVQPLAPTPSPPLVPAGIPSALRYKIISILGPDHVRPAGTADAILKVQPKLVVLPGSQTELSEVLRLVNEAGLAVIPRGGSTKLGWGNPPARADMVLSTARLNRVLEHAFSDLTVSVEAGCTVQTLQETLAQHGQRLAVDPLWPDKATVGGILSTNESGALRLRFGALRDLIIGVTIALPDGTLASSGGKVVKNVAGYDLPKLATGAFGTLGIITRAVFRVHPLPNNTRTFSIRTANPAATRDLIFTLQNSKLAHTALQSQFSGEAQPSSDILFEGTEVGLEAQAAQLRTLCSFSEVSAATTDAWRARQELWSISDPGQTAIATISSLPSDLVRIVDLIRRAADAYRLRWKVLLYATGLGWLRLEGLSDKLQRALKSLRADFEKDAGSLVIRHRPEKIFDLDAWGLPGDSLPLMKAIKGQLDPASTINPGRFLAGI